MAKPTKRDILRLRNAAIDGMVSYMKYGAAESEADPDFDEDFDAGYTQADIDRCAEIVDELLASLENVPQGKENESILNAVKVAVVKLNKLNDRCDGLLIETDQREQLCALIIAAAKRAGLVSSVYDITEQWREW
jgi:hypothetical protein